VLGVWRSHHDWRRESGRRGVRARGATGEPGNSRRVVGIGDGTIAGDAIASSSIARASIGADTADGGSADRRERAAAAEHAAKSHASIATGDLSAANVGRDAGRDLAAIAAPGRRASAGLCVASDDAARAHGSSDASHAVVTGRAAERTNAAVRDRIAGAGRGAGGTAGSPS